jgi:hypothetical protein
MRPGSAAPRPLGLLSLCLATLSLVLGAGSFLHERIERTRVVVIGSGNALSVLVTDGEARLLLAAGDDPTAFANGWRRWAGLVRVSRIDVLLVARTGDDQAVAVDALNDLSPRWKAAVAPLDPAASGGHAVPPLDGPLRFRLGKQLLVTVEVDSASTILEQTAWRMLIERERTVIGVVPDATSAAHFPWNRAVSALIVLRSGVPDATAAVAPRALVVPAEVRGRTLRTEVAPLLPAGIWTVRVAPGEIATLAFPEGGLQLPADADWLEPLPTTPTANLSEQSRVT